ncbi:LPS translocon maturation chaperone LptM [Nitrincola alkalilacustris]
MKSRWPALLLGLMILAVLGGCGQKGPLYLPDQESPTEQAE